MRLSAIKAQSWETASRQATSANFDSGTSETDALIVRQQCESVIDDDELININAAVFDLKK